MEPIIIIIIFLMVILFFSYKKKVDKNYKGFVRPKYTINLNSINLNKKGNVKLWNNQK